MWPINPVGLEVMCTLSRRERPWLTNSEKCKQHGRALELFRAVQEQGTVPDVQPGPDNQGVDLTDPIRFDLFNNAMRFDY